MLAVPSLLRRHSAPVRPPYPLIAPAVGVSKRSASTISASPTVACDPMLARDQSAEKDGSLKRSGTSDPENDDCIEIGDEIVNLICPVALRRIVVPGKGRQCRHVQCFDLETFTNMSRLSPKWKCSVCGDIIEKSDLIVSEPFLHYLAAYPGAERCIIRSNGSHGPYTETMSQMRKKTKVGSKSSPQPDIEVVDLCDDGEESTQSTQPTVVCQPPTPRPNSPSPGMVIENVSQPLLKYAEPAKVDQEQIPLHVPLEASQHSMIWLDRCGENNQSPGDIASAAEGYHCQTDSAHDSAHDDISRMSPEERAALIQRIFADAAEAANQQTGSSSNSPGDEEHDLSMRNGDTDYSSQTRSPRRFGGMVASISSPRADSPSP
ncbi:MIZ/SP-RING zinc finger-domain-containing protein [Fimicolochytrium jonesii]|uniref:MIZ/SP-RING zinc finger-domain-containing protein n=1 Tax=Fimicolochytrium jonesii TaxID=1396493 RepID=UPI0022FE479A|nr:MIZ/SP-RING zinc finger-domain-containing protein [Fimicolochytrium jonesii]KAI8826043.1 MIZ/SP-RING zinc finger-domain-containing protein [Fimicolochytrium jonesii]